MVAVFGLQVPVWLLAVICVGIAIVLLLIFVLLSLLCYCLCCRRKPQQDPTSLPKTSPASAPISTNESSSRPNLPPPSNQPPNAYRPAPSPTRPMPPSPLTATAAAAAAAAAAGAGGGGGGGVQQGKPHVAIPVLDTSAPLTPGASGSGKGGGASPLASPNRRGLGGGAGNASPAAVRKWEEQLQATLFRKMTLEEVRSSTGYFNKTRFLGEGAFAVVYLGTGPNGVPWAVKRSKQHLAEGSSGAADFEKEVLAISRLSHKHLVRLLGYCCEEGEHILIYEYCPCGSLNAALYGGKPELGFEQRLEVALGVAEALNYLHSASSPPIIHRDVKPDNVFLDSQLRAKLGDFGLLKNVLENPYHAEEGEGMGEEERDRTQSLYTRIAGTPGYLDPEYHLTSKVTAKGDVYSFGVLLLQLCTGQRAILSQHPMFSSEAGSSIQSKGSKGSKGTPTPPPGSNQQPQPQGSTASAPAAQSSSSSSAAAGVAGGAGVRGEGSSVSHPEMSSSGIDQREGVAAPGEGSWVSVPGDTSGSMGSSTAFAALGGVAAVMAGPGETQVYPGEPIHISTWVAPYVKAKVVEPVADSRFGNKYNKTAVFRMLEIGLLCVQSSARKRPGMNVVTRWLHEVKERLQREVEEPQGHYSSVFSLEKEVSLPEGMWREQSGVSKGDDEYVPSSDALSSQRDVSVLTSEAACSAVAESAQLTEGR